MWHPIDSYFKNCGIGDLYPQKKLSTRVKKTINLPSRSSGSYLITSKIASLFGLSCHHVPMSALHPTHTAPALNPRLVKEENVGVRVGLVL